jgi:hypothetical protein
LEVYKKAQAQVVCKKQKIEVIECIKKTKKILATLCNEINKLNEGSF